MVGWHPWFRKPEALQFHPTAMYRRVGGIAVDEGLDVTPGPWDDCFTDVTEPPSLCWPGALRIALESSADHWVVYDEPEHALCVEPQTGPPDALNLAPVVVEPGRPLVAGATLRWEIE